MACEHPGQFPLHFLLKSLLEIVGKWLVGLLAVSFAFPYYILIRNGWKMAWAVSFRNGWKIALGPPGQFPLNSLLNPY